MPGLATLSLEDAAEDSPQVRSLLDVFFKDTLLLKKYTEGLLTACKRVVACQNELRAANQGLSNHLQEYEKTKFPLCNDDSILTSTLQQFATIVDEINSWQTVLTTQLTDGTTYRFFKFLDTDLSDILSLHKIYALASQEHDQSIMKYSKLSKKKENETKARIDVSEELFVTRKKYHQTALQYYSALNSLQYKRKTALIEPLIDYMQAYMAFIKMGHESFSQTANEFMSTTTASVQNAHAEEMMALEKNVALSEKVQKEAAYYYTPDPTPDLQMPPRPFSLTLTQKAGYLFIRSKSGFGHKWERQYFFTQGGNLMSQSRDQLAGGLVMDLEQSVVQPAEIDDRRNVLQLSSADNKVALFLQAESGSLRDEWVSTLGNISKGLHLLDNPEETLQEALKALQGLEVNSRNGHQPPETSRPPPDAQTMRAPPSHPEENHQHAADPALINKRLIWLASSGSDSGAPRGHLRLQRSRSSSENAPSTPPPSPMETLLTNRPIQFDLLSPSQESAPRGRMPPKEGPPKRINPFSDSRTEILSDRGLSNSEGGMSGALYPVRFLGCMEVEVDKGLGVVQQTIRHILAARAIHNIFKMNHYHLCLTAESIRLMDTSNQVIKAEFALEDISYSAAHQENSRLLAFILCSRSHPPIIPSFTCYIFESDISGEDICKSINTAVQLAFQELVKRRSIETETEKEQEGLVPAQPGTGGGGFTSYVRAAPSGDGPAEVLLQPVEGQPLTRPCPGPGPPQSLIFSDGSVRPKVLRSQSAGESLSHDQHDPGSDNVT